MPVISFVSPKGGAGKSTSALLLATEIAQKGAAVTVIDCDPEQWIVNWGEGGRVPKNLTIVPRPTEETIIDEIEKAATVTPFVIVDLEGTANMLVAFAISRSDLAIIPTQPSTMDGKSAAKAIRLIKQQERGFNRQIPFAVLFTRTSAAIRPRTLVHLEEQLSAADVPRFQTHLLERNAFKAVFDYACTLEDLPSDIYKREEAVNNARAFAAEVVAMCKKSRTTTTNKTAEEAAA